MATSNILHSGEAPPVVDRGHGTEALGPSDSSDSGSDLVRAAGLAEEGSILDDPGTTSDAEAGHAGGTAGPDVGDANLDSDSDASGTGERAAAGRDTTAVDGADIGTDRVVTAGEIGVTEAEGYVAAEADDETVPASVDAAAGERDDDWRIADEPGRTDDPVGDDAAGRARHGHPALDARIDAAEADAVQDSETGVGSRRARREARQGEHDGAQRESRSSSHAAAGKRAGGR